MKTYLPISYSDQPALAEDEMLDQTEIDAIIEREQREADAFAAKQGAKHGDHDQSSHGGGGPAGEAGVTAGHPGTPTAMPSFTRYDDADKRLEIAREHEGEHVMVFLRQSEPGGAPEGTLHVTDSKLEVGEREFDPMDVRQIAVYGNKAKHGDHDQSTHGGGRGGGAEDLETGGLGNTAITEGGFSVSLQGDNPKTGWMVSQAGTERSFSIEALSTTEEQMGDELPTDPWRDNVKAEVDRFIADEIGELRGPGTFLGGWVDGGRLYLDVSHNIQDHDEAAKFAEENGQLAMYNAETGEYQRFDEEPLPRAASRGPGTPTKEKVYLEVTEDTDTDELTDRLLDALFKS